ncbi:unnamed protein product [Sphagnum troendelagicum]|uniref:Uncharacterized protein n=1 Tax=Sphagnum troendelagicum TaxID=128251 RepID=A0ABP0UX27_9BRYO
MHSMPNASFLHHGALTSRKREETVEAKKLLVDPLFCFPHATRLQKPTGKDARVRPPAVQAPQSASDFGRLGGHVRHRETSCCDYR